MTTIEMKNQVIGKIKQLTDNELLKKAAANIEMLPNGYLDPAKS